MEETTQHDETTLEAIHRLMIEIEETKGKMKEFKQQLKDTMEQNEEYRNLQEELKELTAKRQTAKKILEADNDYQTINAEVDELKFKLKDLQEIFSHHLVTHYNATQEPYIKDNDGEVRQVLLSAKVGKPEAIQPQQ